METFHLALPVTDLGLAKKFYSEVLGLNEKRSSFNWIDFDFWGHQLSLHLVKEKSPRPESTVIDGDQVPAAHFGLILSKSKWDEVKTMLKAKNVKFIIEPKIRFQNKEEEQGTFFLSDPFGNFIEIKYFSKMSDGGWL
jgi:extradiol dioxygenase family protein